MKPLEVRMKPLIDGIRQTPEERRLRIVKSYLLGIYDEIQTLPRGKRATLTNECYRAFSELLMYEMRHPDNGGGGRD